MCRLDGDWASSSELHNDLIFCECRKNNPERGVQIMQTIQFIISILLIFILVMLVINTIRKFDSVLRADVKRLRSENEALRKELLKRGIVEYV